MSGDSQVINTRSWYDGAYFTTFIVGNKYITCLHQQTSAADVFNAVLEEAGEDSKLPFVIVSSAYITGSDDVFLENELAQIVLGY
jgi:tryptophanase